MLGSKRRLIVFNKNDDALLYMPDDTKLPFADLKRLGVGVKATTKDSTANIVWEPKSKILKIKGNLLGKNGEEEWVL